MCLPTGEQDPELKRMQQWLHTNDLLHFDDPAGRLSGGQADGTGSSVQAVVSKHVHVPGIGYDTATLVPVFGFGIFGILGVLIPLVLRPICAM